MATPVRPLVLPDTFCGSSESNWTDWKCHFDNVASINAWSEEDKLKWLKVRLWLLCSNISICVISRPSLLH